MPGGVVTAIIIVFAAALVCMARPSLAAATAPQTSEPRNGAHDFDFEFGTWKTQVSLLMHPLSGSNTWTRYTGTTVVRKIWNGRANIAELEADGPNGHLELLSLRLYNPASHQWSLNVANSRTGTLSVPTVGEFTGGHGTFVDQEQYKGREILDRFEITEVSPNVARFTQSFSANGGKTWELNWVATDTRVKN